MVDKDKVIKGLISCAHYIDCGCDECPYDLECFPGENMFSRLATDALALLKEQEEQKQKWLKQIADAQIAVCPTGNETEEGLAKRTGEWNGLQMAFDILTNGR